VRLRILSTPSSWPALPPFLVPLLLLVGCGGGDGISLPGDGEPAAITIMDGDEQQGRVGEPLNEPLVVQVTDTRGRPVEGAAVAFELTSAGSDVVPDEKSTDANGLADTRVVLGTTVGRQTGNARVVTQDGRPPVKADFSALALSENANSMAAVAGQDQSGHVGSRLDDGLVVKVTDGFGNPVAGVPISWVAEGGGAVSDAVVETDENGRSQAERTLGPTVGQQTTVASSEGLAGSPVTFVHTALAGNASRLVAVSGNGQMAMIGSTLPADLVVRLVDAGENGVPATAVSWVVATGGGSASPENSITDDGGRTSARWTLGDAVGEQRLDAVVSGVGIATFRATATSPAPASLAIRTQPTGSARNGVPFNRQPVIQLRDGSANDVGVAGVEISVAIGSGGGELGGTSRRTTDASGRATFTDLSISGAPGSRTLVFTASGLVGVTSNEIDVSAIATNTTITGDSPDPSLEGSEFPVEFWVSSDGPTPTGSVTVTVSGGPETCSGTLTGGVGTCPLRLDGLGGRTLTATYSGGPGLTRSTDTEPHSVVAQPPANRAPTAAFTSSCVDLTCSFDSGTSTDPDGTIVSWIWNFEDGGTSPERNPSHTFPATGTYQVTLTVTDDDGASDPFSASVRVEAPPPPNQPPAAEFTAQCEDLKCRFTDQSGDSDGRIDNRAWKFGDGATSDERNPSHEYATGGTYTVRLRVTDDDGAETSVEHAVTVVATNQRPTAEFTPSCINLDCQFTDQSTDPDGTIVSWSWEFGDGGSSTLQNPTHSFGGPGTYKVRLTVTDDRGESRSIDHDVQVTAPPPPNQEPTAAFSANCNGLACTFDSGASDDPDGQITAWSWDFQGTGTSDQPDPSHAFPAAGTYSVSLTVTDDQGATGSVTNPVTVTEPSGGGE